MHTAYGSLRSAPTASDGASCYAFEWIELADAEVVVHTGSTVVYRISGSLIMVSAMHVGLVSTARQPGDVGTLVLPRWLAHELGILGQPRA